MNTIQKSAALCALLMLPPGCGGSKNQTETVRTSTGRATYSVRWPTPSRLIPQAATSIRIQILNDTKVIKTVVLAKPATKVTLEDLPAKKLVNLVQAFPNADATGVAQAEVRSEVTIKADESIDVALTMNSTIVRLEPSLTGPVFVDLGGTQTLSVTPRNAAGEAVLVAPGSLRFTSSAPEAATVDAAGVVRGVGSGEATITVTDQESGKSASVPLVAGPVGVVVYSQIDANVRSDRFAQNGQGTIGDVEVEDPSGADFPAIEYGFSDPFPSPFPNVSREFFITFSPGIAVGTRLPVPSLTRNPFADVELVELQTLYDASGNITRRIERTFQGVSGHVTLVKIEGGVHTLRLENVRMQASPGLYYSFADAAEGQGTFVANGTLLYRESNP